MIATKNTVSDQATQRKTGVPAMMIPHSVNPTERARLTNASISNSMASLADTTARVSSKGASDGANYLGPLAQESHPAKPFIRRRAWLVLCSNGSGIANLFEYLQDMPIVELARVGLCAAGN
jgi:hypothetical protein